MPSSDVSITCKAPRGLEIECKALAEASGLSLNKWMIAILEHAAAEKWVVKTTTTVSRSSESPSFRLNEDPAPYGPKKKPAIP